MKRLYDRNSFVFARLDAGQKKRSLIVTAALIGFFLLSAFTFMNALYCLSDCIGSAVSGSPDVSLRDALRSLPVFLSFFMTLSGLLTAHTFYRNESSTLLRKRAVFHTVTGIVFSVLLIVCVAAGLVSGRYLSITEGAPSALYPLDSVMYAIGFIVLGVCVLRYLRKKRDSLPDFGPTRAPFSKKCRLVRRFFKMLWLMFGLYGFCGFFYSFRIVDFTVGYLPYIAAVMLVSLAAFLSVAVWELYYNNLTEAMRRELLLPLSVVSLAFSAGCAMFYFAALRGNLDGPSNVGFGLLPVAYASGFNAATLLVVAVPVTVSVTALVKGVCRRVKAGN